jgi:hypothetical protein
MSSTIRSRRRGAAASRHGCLPRHVAAAALAVLGGLWASAAGAEVLLFSGSGYNFRSTFPSPTILDINGLAAGGTQFTFATTQANQRVVITFNAACAIYFPADGIDHSSDFAELYIEILVDPAGPVGEFNAVPTGNGGREFCSCTGSDVCESSATVVASAQPDVAGTNKVRVRAYMRTNLPNQISGEIGHPSLTITR